MALLQVAVRVEGMLDLADVAKRTRDYLSQEHDCNHSCSAKSVIMFCYGMMRANRNEYGIALPSDVLSLVGRFFLNYDLLAATRQNDINGIIRFLYHGKCGLYKALIIAGREGRREFIMWIIELCRYIYDTPILSGPVYENLLCALFAGGHLDILREVSPYIRLTNYYIHILYFIFVSLDIPIPIETEYIEEIRSYLEDAENGIESPINDSPDCLLEIQLSYRYVIAKIALCIIERQYQEMIPLIQKYHKVFPLGILPKLWITIPTEFIQTQYTNEDIEILVALSNIYNGVAEIHSSDNVRNLVCNMDSLGDIVLDESKITTYNVKCIVEHSRTDIISSNIINERCPDIIHFTGEGVYPLPDFVMWLEQRWPGR